MTDKSPSIRPLYEEHGAQGYYEQFGGKYRNPHEVIIRYSLEMGLARWNLDTTSVLDLACGSGEVTLALEEMGVQHIVGIDPYTYDAYAQRTGKIALQHTFEDIGIGKLNSMHFSLIVCSFALHLVELSRLPMVCYHLSISAPYLLILTPHKRPQIHSAWGWQLHDEFIHERVRSRLYCRINP